MLKGSGVLRERPRMIGVLAGVVASTIWGLVPIYFSELKHVPPGELMAHRVLWAAVVVLAYCALTGRLGRVQAALRDRGAVMSLSLSAGVITVNWLTYLWAVQAGRVTEAGIGYYLMPILSVLLGVVLLRERLGRMQWAAIAMAFAGVIVLSVGVGAAPWLPVVLAVSFALYGLIRKRIETGPIVGFTVEVLLLAPFCLLWLWGVSTGMWAETTSIAGGHFGSDTRTTTLLILAGPVTGVPLILFAEAARRMTLGAAGLVQYVNPSVQLLSAGFVLGEIFSGWHFAALGLIWTGLALYTLGLFGQDRRSSSSATAAEASSTTLR